MPAEFSLDLIALLRNAKHITVFTGAGVSQESGIPTFRDALTGLWENFDAELLATPEAFKRDRDLVWGWYEWRRMMVLRCEPNPAHRAIAAMAKNVTKLTVVTQNVDDLHERAGSREVLHLHGSLHHPRCMDCGEPYVFLAPVPSEPPGGRRLQPPTCGHCGGWIRPGVVWFGESLPKDQWHQSYAAALECDVLFSIGTSAMVYPAATLPIDAAKRGVCVIQINPQPTSLDETATHNLRGKVGEVMASLLEAAWMQS
jgi:NAD-dependent deacetylase